MYQDAFLDGSGRLWFQRGQDGNRRRVTSTDVPVSCPDRAPTSVLTSDSWRSPERHELDQRIIERLGHNPDHVCAIRVTEGEIQVDLIDFDDADWPAITARHLVLDRAPLLVAFR
jgi:hypothetical protein